MEGFSFAYPPALDISEISGTFGTLALEGGQADVEGTLSASAHASGNDFDHASQSISEDAGNSPEALHDVTFSVEEGEFCVLAGPTGCGKSTLLRCLKPELAPVGQRRGSVYACGRCLVRDGWETGELTASESAELVGFVMQDPDSQIVCDTVWHEMAFGLESIGMAHDDMRRRIAEVAHFFGIEPWMHARTEVLSGGQKQLVNLAGVLALRPRLLLLDEPTAQLDPHAHRQFLMTLARIQRELGLTVLMATHAPEGVEDMATQYIYLGSLGPLGRKADLEERMCRKGQNREKVRPQRPHARALRYLRQSEEGPLHTSTSSTHTGEVTSVSFAQAAPSAPVALSGSGALLRSLVRQRDETPAIETRNLYFRYGRGDAWVLRGVDAHVREGSVHAFVGGNGCGKSTLLKLMAGVLKAQRGSVRNALSTSQVMLPQDPKALLVCDSVAEELSEWRERCGYAPADEAVMLERFGLCAYVAQHPYDLSGGQQQKLAFAKLLLTGARLLMLDEPTKGLDPTSCADVVRIVRDVSEEGRTVVVVTHDLDFVFACADEVSMLFDGELACTQPADEFFAANLIYRPNEKSRLFGVLL